MSKSDQQQTGKVEAITAALRRDILDLVLAPGTVILRPRLEARFEASSTPVRDALIQLQREGLIGSRPQSRTFVTKIDLDQAHRDMLLRRALDLEIAALVIAGRPEGLIATLEALLAGQRAAAAAGDEVGFLALDMAFHQAQYQAVDADDLWDLVNGRRGHILRALRLAMARPDHAQNILEDHAAIIAGLREGDRAATEAAIRRHLDRQGPYITVMRETWPEYFT